MNKKKEVGNITLDTIGGGGLLRLCKCVSVVGNSPFFGRK